MPAPRVAIAPEPVPGWVREAVAQGGGREARVAEADALVWLRPLDVEGLVATLAHAGPGLRWVQLPFAGVEDFGAAGVFDDGRQWTAGQGVYAEPVAEHVLALGLAGLRDLPERVRATSWGRPSGRSLYDGRVTILGGGGIARALLALLVPFRVETTVVRRHPEPPAVGLDHLHQALAGADLVVLALALTAETEGVIGAAELRAMQPHAWLVNVARGRHVVTDDLVRALAEGWIGGAALDVTHPEPLPDGHPLWDLPNCVITPHTANTPEMAQAPLAARIAENVRRFALGQRLVGLVDPALGY